MARIAETVVGVFRLQVELPRRDSGIPDVDVVKEYVDLAQTLLPAFVCTLDAVLRRQMIAVTERMWSTDEERSAVTLLRTVGFVDLVGYTSAAASMSVRELTTVLVGFDERTAEVVAHGHGQIVKTIGDEAMFVTEDAADACRIALDLVDGGAGSYPPSELGLPLGKSFRYSGTYTVPMSTWPPALLPLPIRPRQLSPSRFALPRATFSSNYSRLLHLRASQARRPHIDSWLRVTDPPLAILSQSLSTNCRRRFTPLAPFCKSGARKISIHCKAPFVADR